MKVYWIKEPVWKERCVYVHQRNLNRVVGIKYRDKFGNQVWTKVVSMTPNKVKHFETKTFNWGTAWKVPLGEFE